MTWQPIETAPKGDGSFPLSSPQEVLLTEGSSVFLGFWNGRSWDDGDWRDDMGEMTHWMPLPELPEAPAEISLSSDEYREVAADGS